MFGYAPVQFVQSIIRVLPKLPAYFEPYFLSSIGGYIPENRNMLVKQLIDLEKQVGKMDYVLWLDSDIEFEIEDVLELWHSIESEPKASMVSGISYAYKNGQVFPLVMRKTLGQYKWVQVDDFEEVDSASLGFVLMKAEVLRELVALKNSHRLFSFSERNFDFMGEDNMFFELCKENGHVLFADGGVVVRHVKPIGLDEPKPFKEFKEDSE